MKTFKFTPRPARCERTGARIYHEFVYRDGRWIAHHITMYGPGALDEPLRAGSDEPGYGGRAALRIAQ
jgi:hypothetical protein